MLILPPHLRLSISSSFRVAHRNQGRSTLLPLLLLLLLLLLHTAARKKKEVRANHHGPTCVQLRSGTQAADQNSGKLWKT